MKKYLVILFIISFTGCATILENEREEINIKSEPQGADFFINGVYFGKTPQTVSLERSLDHLIVFELDGYHSKIQLIQRDIQGWYVVLDLLFGVLPAIYDGVYGSWCSLTPVSVYLQKETK
jgi:hypothetical protein